MEFTRYYGKHKRQNDCVIQTSVLQEKGKTLQIRIDSELNNVLESLAKELNQNPSKVARDILEDFFLTKKLLEQKEDVEDFLNRTESKKDN